MSLTLFLRPLSDDNIKKLLAHPPLIWRVIAPEGLPGGDANELPSLELSEAELARGYLDKAWHGIHYLLTGGIWGGSAPLNAICAGGVEMDLADADCDGTVRVLKSAEVKALDAALKPIDADYLRQRFNAEDMKQKSIYPPIWDRDDSLGYCLHYFETFKGFVSGAAANGLGLVLHLW